MQTWLDWTVKSLYVDALDTKDLAAPVWHDLDPSVAAVLDTVVPQASGATPLTFARAFTAWILPLRTAIDAGSIEAAADRKSERLGHMHHGIEIANILSKSTDCLSANEACGARYADFDGGMIALLHDLAPHLTGDPAALALRLSPELVEDLREAKAPQSDLIDEILQERPLYIDLPQGALRVGNDFQVRAIALRYQRVRSGVMALWADAVITKPGRNAIEGVMQWSLSVAPEGREAYVSNVIDEFDAAAAARELDEFIRLVVAYAVIAEPQTGKPVGRVDERRLRTDRNWPASTKKWTMFTVRDVDTPKNRFERGQSDRSAGKGWRLGWESVTRGHFKMQAHGPKSSLRKLIWVAEYTRGAGGDARKSEIINLKSAGTGR